MPLLVISFLGFSLMIATGLAALARIPGLHFDEAWAANYAYRILTEKGFWPLDAMSPYTHPWAHYWTAGFFHLFGVNLFVYRAAGLSMCVLGAFLAWVTLVRIGERKAAISAVSADAIRAFRLERAALPGNHDVYIFCLGLLMFGAQIHSRLLSTLMVFIAVILGVTSHILFVAPVLGLLAVWGLQSGRWQWTHRLLVFLGGLSLFPFLWHVYRTIPEKDKAILLVIADCALMGTVLFFGQMPRVIRRMRENIQWLVTALVIPFCFYLAVFSEGHWSVLFSQGRIMAPWVLFFSVPFTVGALIFLVRVYARQKWTHSQERFWSWILFTLFWLGVLAVKPAPRYFAMGFFLIALGGAVLLGQIGRARASRFLIPFGFVSALILVVNVWIPGTHGEQVDRSFRFLFFKDDSSDSLPKQDLVRYLGGKGCSPAQVTTGDPRLAEALKFLSHGDWPITPGVSCPTPRGGGRKTG